MNIRLLDNNTVGLFFEYSPAVVAMVKQLPGRQYEPRLKAWLLGVDDLLPDSLKKLESVGFAVDDKLRRLLAPPGRNTPALEGFNASELPGFLFPFQKQGVLALLAGNRLLGDQPGLGKTIQAIAMCQMLKPQRVLFLTFASLKFQFEGELKKFWPEATCTVINGTKKQRTDQWKANTVFKVANYELLLRDLPEMVQSWDIIIADECTRLSNHRNKQWKALNQLPAKKKIAMTGTAVSNSPLDVYGILHWLYPNILGNYYGFINRYVVKDLWGSAKYYKNLDELSKRIQPYYIRRTKEQVLPELPEKIKIEIPFELSAVERKLYDQIRSELLFDIEKACISKIESPVQMQNTVVKLLRLRQLANGMELLGDKTESSKLTVLKDLLSTLNGGKKIIFSEFAEMCKILNREIPSSLMIIGETATEERNNIVNRFNTDPEVKVLVMSSAGAYGLNLQAADVVIHTDLPWSIAKYEQRAARSHRMGQKNTVYEYSLVAKHTVDEFVLKKLESKQEISERLMPVTQLKELLDI